MMRLDYEIEEFMDATEPPAVAPKITVDGWNMRSRHTFMEEE